MSSIFLGLINKDISKDTLDSYNSVGIPHKIPGLREIDVSKLATDVIRTKNGGKITIHPAEIASRALQMLNYMRSQPTYSFLVPYIQKPIIWTYLIDTAMTDGVRIYMSPLFAHLLLVVKNKDADEHWNSLTPAQRLKADYAKENNAIQTKLLRFVIVHECYHILYNHSRRAVLKYGSNPTKEEHDRANIAMDLEINRDIESSFADLVGSTEEIGDSVWYLYKEFYKSDGTVFRKAVWEPIWDDWTNSNKQFNNNSQFKDKDYNPKQRDKAQQGPYADGWRKAVDAIKSKRIDPKNLNI